MSHSKVLKSDIFPAQAAAADPKSPHTIATATTFAALAEQQQLSVKKLPRGLTNLHPGKGFVDIWLRNHPTSGKPCQRGNNDGVEIVHNKTTLSFILLKSIKQFQHVFSLSIIHSITWRKLYKAVIFLYITAAWTFGEVNVQLIA